MNLHNIRIPFAKRSLVWVAVRGSSGRFLGYHLWMLDRGTNTDGPEERPQWAIDYRWWTPAYFGWLPYQEAIKNLFINGWVRPICGKTSRSRNPFGDYTDRPSSYRTPCRDCERIAAGSGTIVYTDLASDEEVRALRTEERTWRVEYNDAHR